MYRKWISDRRLTGSGRLRAGIGHQLETGSERQSEARGGRTRRLESRPLEGRSLIGSEDRLHPVVLLLLMIVVVDLDFDVAAAAAAAAAAAGISQKDLSVNRISKLSPLDFSSPSPRKQGIQLI